MNERIEKNNPNEIRGPEPLHEQNISVIGMGRLGTKLVQRLQEITPQDTRIRPVGSREENKSAASVSDLVILTVRHDQVSGTLSDMDLKLNRNAQILSFATHVPVTLLERVGGKPSARFLCDPWFHVGAYVLGEGFSTKGIEFIFDNLTEVKPVRLQSDEELEQYTHDTCHLYATLFLKALGEFPNADAHLQFLAGKMNVRVEDLLSIKTGETPQQAIALFATPGGVTEAMMKKLRENPDIVPEAV